VIPYSANFARQRSMSSKPTPNCKGTRPSIF
jgi:hypothetical protein